VDADAHPREPSAAKSSIHQTRTEAWDSSTQTEPGSTVAPAHASSTVCHRLSACVTAVPNGVGLPSGDATAPSFQTTTPASPEVAMATT
jgi:hypothetical protein